MLFHDLVFAWFDGSGLLVSGEEDLEHVHDAGCEVYHVGGLRALSEADDGSEYLQYHVEGASLGGGDAHVEVGERAGKLLVPIYGVSQSDKSRREVADAHGVLVDRRSGEVNLHGRGLRFRRFACFSLQQVHIQYSTLRKRWKIKGNHVI